MCYIVVSAETPQTTTNPSQTLLPVYKLVHLPLSHSKSSSPRPPPPPTTTHTQPLAKPFVQMRYRCYTGPNILEVYIIYLHVYVSVDILTHIACATTQNSLCIFKVCQNFRCSHTQSKDVDKDKDQILNPASGLNCGLVFIYIHTLRVRAAKVLVKL